MAAFLVLMVILALPVDLVLRSAGTAGARVEHVLATAAALYGMLAFASLLRSWLAGVLVALVLGCAFVLRSVFFGLVRFTGTGFSDEVFLHLEPQSFRVAWMEFSGLIMAMGAVLVALLWVSMRYAHAIRALPRRIILLLLLPALGLLAVAWPVLPEVQFATVAHRWYGPRTLPMTPAELQRWRASKLVKLDLRPKHSIHAELPAEPSNLILLYIESGGAVLAHHPRYPDLMPTLRRLIEQHALLEDLHASAYITIEGIANSMCGTLFPFRNGSDAMAGAEGMAESMPCFGDVLSAAGYVQTYLGGASLEFAGKGKFLRAHGYDHVMGSAEWRARDLNQRPGTWGVSDADLFEQSHHEIARLRATGRPFNLTLLTIGTHLPGFRYAECAPYRDGAERFLDAASCTDQLLARWLARLRASGQLADTLVVITADHHVFPNPEMKRLFGDQAVYDRRLPLVLLGAGANAHAATRAGASYDLAPTVLDLLGIQHDAVFALGRSLLRSESVRNTFFRKYEDVHRGQAAVNRPASDCSRERGTPPQPPLRGCEKRALLDLLALQHAAFSLPPAAVQCSGVGENRVTLPLVQDEPVQFVIGGRDQFRHFSWGGRPVAPRTPGLYLIVLDRYGVVLQHVHIPAGSATLSEGPPETTGARAWLVTWLGDPAHETQRPAWLPQGDGVDQSWLFDARSGEVVRAAGTVGGVSDALQLEIDGPVCDRLFEPSDPEERSGD